MRRFGGFFGEGRREVRAGAFDCHLARAVIAPDDVPDHVHDEAHFVFAIDRGYVSAAYAERPTGKPGALVYNPPGTDHRDRFSKTGGRFLGISFDASLSPERGTRHPRPLLDGRLHGGMVRILGMVISAVDTLDVEGAMLDLLADFSGIEERFKAPNWLKTSRDAIHELASCPDLSVADVARAANVHPVYLARAFRHAYGHGPSQAIQLARLDAVAAEFGSEKSLADLANAYGFSDQSHLNRSFRRLWGTTPGAVREALQ